MIRPRPAAPPRRRVPCEHCERKFTDAAGLARHVRTVHKKSAKLVAELRAMVQRALAPPEPMKVERCNCDASCGENRYHDRGAPGCRYAHGHG